MELLFLLLTMCQVQNLTQKGLRVKLEITIATG